VTTARALIYRMLADGEPDRHFEHRIVNIVILMAIGITVSASILSTIPRLGPLGPLILTAYSLASAIFTVEFLGRLWTAPEAVPHSQRSIPIGQKADTPSAPLSARLAYLGSFLGMADAASVLPVWVWLLFMLGEDAVHIAAMIVLIKLGRYVPGLALLAAVVRREAMSLLGALTAVFVLLLIISTIMYMLERERQPLYFSTIPDALWWGVVTIATIGYGDMKPVTVFGKMFGGLVMMLGVALFAVPAGILATGFANELRKREFVVTWRTVARVPLFAELDASQIASVASLLKPQVVPGSSVIVRRGDAAQAMFFIMEGEVEVDVLPRPVRLAVGDYFGEIALLRDLRRTATVAAITECRLLTLDVADFRRLMDKYPELRQQLERTASQRMGT